MEFILNTLLIVCLILMGIIARSIIILIYPAIENSSWFVKLQESRTTAAEIGREVLVRLLNYFQYKTVWRLLNPTIVSISKSRFESGHYADAIEASLKEINSVLKEFVKERTGREMDGADLINVTFAGKSPLIVVADNFLEDSASISVDSKRNIQEGYWHMSLGAWQAIRNPTAHANLKISRERALYYLFLASMIMDEVYKAAERTKRINKQSLLESSSTEYIANNYQTSNNMPIKQSSSKSASVD
jgi:uncharacterized protein (TIGR02391 family)